MDKYEQIRNQVIWAVTHYGLVDTDGIIETLRKTVLELDAKQLQNKSANSDYAKYGMCAHADLCQLPRGMACEVGDNICYKNPNFA